MSGLFNISFNNVPGTNPTSTGLLPANSIQIVLALPAEIEFADTYTPPSGWTFTKTGPNSVVLRQIAAISSSFPASFVTFAVPLRTKAPVIDGVWSAQIQRLAPTFQDPDPNNSSPSGVVSVADVNLPVTLVKFSAKKEGNSSLLSWNTAEEINSDYFQVEHSQNAKEWSALGRLYSHGDSRELNTYSYVHQNPAPGTNYYRLKMVDKDLTFAYSKVEVVSLSAKGLISVFPNPATDFIKVESTRPVQAYRIYDMAGIKKLSSPPTADGRIDVKALPGGIYLLHVKYVDGSIHTQQFLVTH
jgi:hypothetical protein